MLFTLELAESSFMWFYMLLYFSFEHNPKGFNNPFVIINIQMSLESLSIASQSATACFTTSEALWTEPSLIVML